MSVGYLLNPNFQVVNTAGKPATGGWLEVYIHGGGKYYCFSDFHGTLHPFKIELDSLGSNIVLADNSNAYDVYIYNRYGSLLMSRENVNVGGGSGGGGGTEYTAGAGIKIEGDTILVDDTLVAMRADLAAVSFSGDYYDLLNRPTIPDDKVLIVYERDLMHDSDNVRNKINTAWSQHKVIQLYWDYDNKRYLLTHVDTQGGVEYYWFVAPTCNYQSGVWANTRFALEAHVWTYNTSTQEYGQSGAAMQFPELPSLSGNAGKVLTVNSGATEVEWTSLPSPATDNFVMSSTDVANDTEAAWNAYTEALDAGKVCYMYWSSYRVYLRVTTAWYNDPQLTGESITFSTVVTDFNSSNFYSTYGAELRKSYGITPVTYTLVGPTYKFEPFLRKGSYQPSWTENDNTSSSYIQNKPTEKELTAGQNISITETSNAITIDATDTTYSAGDGIGITNNVINRKVQFVTTSSTYSAIRHVLDEGDVPVLDVSNGSYHNYFYPTHKSGTHVDFVGSMGYSTYPTYEAANYLLKYSIDNNNAWTVSKYHELPYFAAADAYKTLRVNSSGNGVEWTVEFPAVRDINGLQTYTVTADDVANGYALVPAFQLPYASKESTVSLAADLIAFDLLRSNAHLYFAGVTKFEAFLGTSDATKGYMFRRVENPATAVSDSGAALTEAADMWRWHLVHNGGRNTSDVTHLLIKAYIDSSVQVGDQFSWEGGLVQFNA